MVTDELTRTMLIFGLIATGSSVFMVKLISRIHGSFKPYFKATMLYLLVAILLMSAVASVSYWSYLKDQQLSHLLFQAYFLILGTVHVNWLKEYIKWAGNEQSLWVEFLFTVILGLLGGIGFMAVFSWFSEDVLAVNMSMSVILFVVPWLVNQTYLNAISIPAPILKQWFYPVSQEVDEPDEDKLKNLLVISFVIQKQLRDSHKTNFRAKAPIDMDLGELFYYFINDYNERHPNDKIEYVDQQGEPFGWVFYKKPLLSIPQKQYVDAEKTIYNNKIKENNVIICNRYFTS